MPVFGRNDCLIGCVHTETIIALENVTLTSLQSSALYREVSLSAKPGILRSMSVTIYQEEIHTASRLAREAGAIIMEIYATEFAVAFKGRNDPVTGITRALRCGSVGLKVGMIASNQADVYIEPSRLSSAWDACGPEAILRGAGGRFTDMAGQTMIYGGTDLRNRKGLVATNAVSHELVLASLKSLSRDARPL